MCERLGDGDCLIGAFDREGHANADLFGHAALQTGDKIGGAVLECLGCEGELAGVKPDPRGGYELAVRLPRSALG